MSEVSWIKVKVGMFDGESFKRIKRAKIGDSKYRDKLTAIWFELMDLAAKCNRGGRFINNRDVPFDTIEDIAIMIDRETEELEMCMQFFINNGMVEFSDGVYALSNWNEYQNEEKLEEIREKERQKKARYRERLALKSAEQVDIGGQCGGQCGDNGGTSGGLSIIEGDKEKEKDISSSSAPAHTRKETPNDEKLRYLGGKLFGRQILMSESQMEDLLDRLSLDEFEYYVSVIREAEENGKHYKKSHYQAILDMVEEDRRKKDG